MAQTNPLVEVLGQGQSIWYDNIRRSLLTSGELERMAREDALRGVTSNPTIFEHAISGSSDYAAQIAELRAAGVTDAKAIYEALAIADIQAAADVLRPVYDESDRVDGYVSLEVSPTLAHDTDGTVAEAQRLWNAVGRENLMIKVPATPAGIAAVRTLLGRGINVNVTLLFAAAAYEQVADAYMTGLEEYAALGGDVSRVASVASFFVSRIDSAIDPLVGEELAGKVAIANAKVTYARAGELYASDRWATLEARGARTQRLLWASTGTKNPEYSDVLYVEELIGPDTVDTVPPATYDAFCAHGTVRASLEEDIAGADAVMAALPLDFDAVAAKLLEEGLASFSQAFDSLLRAVALQATLADWETNDKVRRVWARDASVWTGADEASWLGWLGIVHDQLADGDDLRKVAEIAGEFDHVVLLGMGGSSLAPEVLALTFGGHLRILDSTDPAQLKAVEDAVDLEKTLFIVSSKSGSTLEPNIFKDYFLVRASADQFIAITDPGSKVEEAAREAGFRHIAHGVPSIGGRYSALSNFGLVPAAAMDVDVFELLRRAKVMVDACGPTTPAAENPGLVLGATLGTAAVAGRDKLTLVVSPGIGDLGAWLEQLIAESTGKQGTGIIPVDREPVGDPSAYGDDRLFVYVRLDSAPDELQDRAVAALEKAGHPLVTLHVAEPYDIGAEFFRWEFATAVAGSVIGIHPFDQPDVEAAKIATRQLTDEYERTGGLPSESSLRIDDEELGARVAAHLARIERGDYAALLAYIPMTPEHEAVLTEIRRLIRDRTTAATCVGFGPRFLHSTGQAYKGGPGSGVFLQITCDDAADLEIPGRRATFGVVKAAQARGDLKVLEERGRRVLRVHLGTDVAAGLARLRDAVDSAL
jgi:transaldolase/glucose-6-phosphate isomerase